MEEDEADFTAFLDIAGHRVVLQVELWRTGRTPKLTPIRWLEQCRGDERGSGRGRGQGSA